LVKSPDDKEGEPVATDVYGTITGAGSFKNGSLTSEILRDMLKSPRLFKIKDGSLAELKRHVMAREQIVKAAKNAKFLFAKSDTGEVNSDHWKIDVVTVGSARQARYKIISGDAYGAVQDIRNNPDKYGFGCREGSMAVMLLGLLDVMSSEPGGVKRFSKAVGEQPFVMGRTLLVKDKNGAPGDWVPGDWGYIKNTGKVPSSSQQGMNIIYVGGGKYWGHTDDPVQLKPVMKSGKDWFDIVEGWDPAKDTAAVSGDRDYPDAGLIGK
jgi:hypothetical protein